MSEPKWKTWWEDNADPESFLQVQMPRTRNVRRVIYDIMKNVLTPGASVLDVACGAAVDYTPITEMGFNWTGVDMTEKFVDYVRDTFTADMHRMDVSQGLNFKTRQFNMSYAKDLFEHLPPNQWKAVITEMWRVSDEYMILSFFKPPGEAKTEYHIVTEEESPNTAGVYSNHYNRKELIDFIMSLPRFFTVSVKESLLYRQRWAHPKGYSIWLVKKR